VEHALRQYQLAEPSGIPAVLQAQPHDWWCW
jgi:hypothetical protein